MVGTAAGVITADSGGLNLMFKLNPNIELSDMRIFTGCLIVDKYYYCLAVYSSFLQSC